MIEEVLDTEVIKVREEPTVRFLHFDSEAAVVSGGAKDKKGILDGFLRNGGAWRFFDFLDRKVRDDRSSYGEALETAEKIGLSNVIDDLVESSHSRHSLSGVFFEELSYSVLSSKLSANSRVISPEETKEFILGIEEGRRFSTIPDGAVFGIKNKLLKVIGLAEYKSSPAGSLADEHWEQYENLIMIAKNLYRTGIRSNDKSLTKRIFSARGQTIRKVESDVDELKIYYVVPRGLSDAFSFSGTSHAEIVESPFTREDAFSLAGALALDYLAYKDELYKNSGPGK